MTRGSLNEWLQPTERCVETNSYQLVHLKFKAKQPRYLKPTKDAEERDSVVRAVSRVQVERGFPPVERS